MRGHCLRVLAHAIPGGTADQSGGKRLYVQRELRTSTLGAEDRIVFFQPKKAFMMLAGKPGEHVLHRKTERGHLFELDVVLRLITITIVTSSIRCRIARVSAIDGTSKQDQGH